jgi:tetratricopeptide (TPR) repeat protein
MMTNRYRARRGLGWAVALILVLAAGIGSAADVRGRITKTDGGRVVGTIRWRPASRLYVVNTGGRVSLEIPLRQVQRIEAEKPTELNELAKMVQRKQYAAAISRLENLLSQYDMLQWDVEIARWLGEAYLRTGQADKAASVISKIERSGTPTPMTGEIVGVYWDALLETEQFAKLRTELDKAVKQGSRDVAAVAQLKRGDIDMKKGNFEDALLDGYLRTVVFFREVRHVQPEAMAKAATCFQELGQTTQAEKWRKKLLTEYPDSPQAQDVRAGM